MLRGAVRQSSTTCPELRYPVVALIGLDPRVAGLSEEAQILNHVGGQRTSLPLDIISFRVDSG